MARSCDGCTMCCKTLKIKKLSKPQGVWCPNCEVGIGCKIYTHKPKECTDFHCLFIQDSNSELLDDFWRPSISHIVGVVELGGNRLALYVDVDQPEVWKSEPYYSSIKKLSINLTPRQIQIMVIVGTNFFMIFPHHDIDLGNIPDNKIIVTEQKKTIFGLSYNAYLIDKNDPKAKDVAFHNGRGLV